MHTGKSIEIARSGGRVDADGIQRLKGGSAGALALQMTDRCFGIGPAAHDDVLQMGAERDLDRCFVSCREVDQLGNSSLDASELARLGGRQHFAHTSVEAGAAFVNASECIKLGTGLPALFL